jgi:hypothetical protein
VFDCRGDDVALLRLSGKGGVNRGVVAFAAAAIEDDFRILRPEQTGDLGTGCFQRRFDLSAKAVH